MAKKTYNTILEDENYNLHPQTNAKQVLTGENNENNLQNELNAINDKFAQIKENEKNKGAFKNYNALISKYHNNIDNPLDRAGWTAIVEDEDKQYFYDTEENKWKIFKSGDTSGIESVNGKTDKNIVLTGSDINSTIDSSSTKTITQHLQDIKDITSDIKQTTINGKTLDENVELKATDIPTTFEDGASIQSHLADLDLKYNDQEDAIKEIENELEPLKNKTSVLYLNNQQMYDAINALVEPYENGQLVIANDDGNYKLGSSYKFVIGGTVEEPQYSWEEITSSGDGNNENILNGTQSEPIILWDLDYGIYRISGYFKTNSTSSYTNIVNGYATNDNPYVTINISPYEKSTETTKMLIINDSYLYYGNIFFRAGYESYLTFTNTTERLNNGNLLYYSLARTYTDSFNTPQPPGTFLSVDNPYPYTPTSDYHPATKKLVEDTKNEILESVIPIKFVEDPTLENLSENIGNIYSSNSENTNDFYFVKQSGIQKTYLVEDVEYQSITVDKSIVDKIVDFGFTRLPISAKRNNGTSSFGICILTFEIDNTTSKISKLYLANSLGTYNFPLYDNGTWYSNEINVNNVFANQSDKDGHRSVFIRKSNFSTLTTTLASVQDLFYYAEPKSSSIRVALYEDIKNSGGSSTTSTYSSKLLYSGGFSLNTSSQIAINTTIPYFANYNMIVFLADDGEVFTATPYYDEDQTSYYDDDTYSINISGVHDTNKTFSYKYSYNASTGAMFKNGGGVYSHTLSSPYHSTDGSVPKITKIYGINF